MLKLFLDSANQYLFLALYQDEQVVFHYLEESYNKHSENLVKRLDELLKTHGYKMRDLEAVYVGKGPGSYTGVRVSCTVGKTLAFIHQIPLYSFSSLDLIASRYLLTEGQYIVIMDARREMVYGKVLSVENQKVTTLEKECFCTLADLKKLYPNALVLTSQEREYQVVNLLKTGLTIKSDDIHTFVPTYLRSGV